ncbi:MAG: hypothetical protein SGCHY_001671, partial [Lobulomycetales sp.]
MPTEKTEPGNFQPEDSPGVNSEHSRGTSESNATGQVLAVFEEPELPLWDSSSVFRSSQLEMAPAFDSVSASLGRDQVVQRNASTRDALSEQSSSLRRYRPPQNRQLCINYSRAKNTPTPSYDALLLNYPQVSIKSLLMRHERRNTGEFTHGIWRREREKGEFEAKLGKEKRKDSAVAATTHFLRLPQALKTAMMYFEEPQMPLWKSSDVFPAFGSTTTPASFTEIERPPSAGREDSEAS